MGQLGLIEAYNDPLMASCGLYPVLNSLKATRESLLRVVRAEHGHGTGMELVGALPRWEGCQRLVQHRGHLLLLWPLLAVKQPLR